MTKNYLMMFNFYKSIGNMILYLLSLLFMNYGFDNVIQG